MIPLMPAILQQIDPDVAAHYARMADTSNDVIMKALNDLIVGLKDDGVWPLLDQLCVLQANEADSLLNLNGGVSPVNVGVPFVAGVGFGGEPFPSTGYMKSGIIPGSAGFNVTPASSSLFFYTTTYNYTQNVNYPIFIFYDDYKSSYIEFSSPSSIFGEMIVDSTPDIVTDGTFANGLASWQSRTGNVLGGAGKAKITASGGDVFFDFSGIVDGNDRDNAEITQELTTVPGEYYAVRHSGSVGSFAQNPIVSTLKVGTTAYSDDIMARSLNTSAGVDVEIAPFVAKSTKTYISLYFEDRTVGAYNGWVQSDIVVKNANNSSRYSDAAVELIPAVDFHGRGFIGGANLPSEASSILGDVSSQLIRTQKAIAGSTVTANDFAIFGISMPNFPGAIYISQCEQVGTGWGIGGGMTNAQLLATKARVQAYMDAIGVGVTSI